jgi:hypothetical protein
VTNLKDAHPTEEVYAFSFVFWCVVSAAAAFARSVGQMVALRIPST